MTENPKMLQGHLDLILLTILEAEPLYGFRITQQAQQLSDGYFSFKEGSLYPALHRLEQAGLLTAEEREAGRNGKPRKYYRLSELGRAALQKQRHAFDTFTRAVRALTRST